MSADQELASTGLPSLAIAALAGISATLGGLFVSLSRKGAGARKKNR